MKQSAVVTGRTTVIPLIGHPVGQVRSPGPMNRWFMENNIDAVIVPMDIRPERISSFFDVLRAMENCAGCSITMPHKQAAFIASDEVTERARRAKAVNTIRRLPSGRLTGDMTDGLAMVAALESRDVSIAGCNVLLVGAGGAGTAIAFELAEKDAASLTILEPDQMRRRALISELERLYPTLPVHDQVSPGWKIDIAINASPLGMDPNDPLPFPVEQIADAMIVADAVTKPMVTRWLKDAEKRKLKIQTGEEMAAAQLPIQLAYLRFMPPTPKKQAADRPEPAVAAKETGR